MNPARPAERTLRIGAFANPRHLAAACGFAICYWLLVRYGALLPVKASGISYFWPAEGLALGVLLRVPVRNWPPYLAALVAAAVLASTKPLALNLLYAFFATLAPVVAALAVRRVLGARPRIARIEDVMLFVTCVATVTALMVLVRTAVDVTIFHGDFEEIAKVWWLSNSLGILIITPLFLALPDAFPAGRKSASAARIAEALLVYASVAVYIYLTFSAAPGQTGTGRLTLTPLLWPAVGMFWAAMRFGSAGGAVCIALVAMQTSWFTAHGQGPFVSMYGDASSALIQLQINNAVAAALILVTGAFTAERRAAVAESAVTRKRLEFAIQASNMVVFETVPGRDAIVWSGDTDAALGIAADALLTLAAWTERIHPDDRPALARLHEELTRGARTAGEIDYRLRRDSGDYITVNVSAYRATTATADLPEPAWPLIGVLQNVTDKRRAEEERHRLEARLHQAEKMEAIGSLAGGIAHDFNNILGAILGYAEMLQGRTQAGSRERKYADTIASAGERGKALVAQVLTFSRAATPEKSPVDLRLLVEEVIEVLKGAMPSNIRLYESMPAAPAMTLGNVTHLHQLAMNLLTNAIQAMPGGGDLKVSIALVDNPDERLLRGGALPAGRFVVFEVEDQGAGIPPEVMPKIFDPFFSTKERGKGTGLGLSIAHGVARSHGGAIEVESRPGAGTRFTVYLPESAAPQAVDARAAPAAPAGSGQAILVVDDELPLVELATEMLGEMGYACVGFTSSRAALEEFRRAPERYSALVTDEVMPELSGCELCVAVRAVVPHLPVLLASVYGGAGFEQRAGAAGVNRMLPKPWSRQELAAALDAVLAEPAENV